MAVLKFQHARETVLEQIRSAIYNHNPTFLLEEESVSLLESNGRVLAERVCADRDFPPFQRSTRDGFAVRSADLAHIPVELQCQGLVKAGEQFAGIVRAMECVEIMTGAPVSEGADAVVMVEYMSQKDNRVQVNRAVAPAENVVARGSEARQGELLLPAGRRIGYAEISMMASVGREKVSVYRKPRVAIIPTGDEVVEVGTAPGPFQIRNSNGYSLQAQVASAQSIPLAIGIAPDEESRLKQMIEEGLESDLLLLSGGVSMGKFDLVEKVLAELEAEFFFDGVAIQPGKPLAFGCAGGTFFFGLPGNPLSTMVTFELFVRPALALLSGESAAPLIFLRARLAKEFRRKPGLAAFLPSLLEGGYHDPVVSLVQWKGSGDVASVNRANCYLAIPEEAEVLQAGDWVSVLPR